MKITHLKYVTLDRPHPITGSDFFPVKMLAPQYDAEPPVRPVFKFIHGPVTRHGCRQSCYTVQIGAPA